LDEGYHGPGWAVLGPCLLGCWWAPTAR
jgi:hypothetical protein